MKKIEWILLFVNYTSIKLIRKKKKKRSRTNHCNPSMPRHPSSQIICGLQSQAGSGVQPGDWAERVLFGDLAGARKVGWAPDGLGIRDKTTSMW